MVGGGITGLSAAYRLREIAATREIPLEVALLERGDRVGGPLETIRRDGFVIETGADSFLSEKPWAADLARRLGLGAELIPTREIYRRTFVVRAGHLVAIPAGFSMLAPSHLGPVFFSPLFSILGKLRIALEPLIPARTDGADESLASFVTRRLGREVLERVAQPLAGGIYTADPNRLSIAATLPRFVEMERRHGSLIKGLRAAERSSTAKNRNVSGARWSLFQSFKTGMAALPKALAAKLGSSIRKSAEVVAMSRDGERWRLATANGDTVEADAVIVAAPAYATARILSSIAPRAAQLLAQISYASAATVNLAFMQSDFPAPPEAFGFVVPAIERRRIIAGSFSSFKFEGRAPDGAVLARAFVGGVLQKEMMLLSDDEIVAAVRDEFRALLGIGVTPTIVEVRRWPNSMPQYEVGHLARVTEIETLLADVPAFAIAGAAYRGVGIPDCVRSGEQASDAIFAKLISDT
ncbi:MAG: protoporphyrinogen oxidase [Candidatus Binatus sp.]|uniref:protoporphyrinogen oxidase n=1 Tax=Candidatus Binatus sp. TaxID=2811406 RepID=UPI002722AB76|nr:protoporphyrinogen oxidase [Candidatus Binatus sp.]MDO8433681.1 protoporphyrinogen oxidase [Candidatus Binatus sp.]